jgi:alcohol dehydrogenase class IV
MNAIAHSVNPFYLDIVLGVLRPCGAANISAAIGSAEAYFIRISLSTWQKEGISLCSLLEMEHPCTMGGHMNTYRIDQSPVIVAGQGALAELAPWLRQFGTRSVLLVSDRGMAAAGWVDRLNALLADWTVATYLAPPGEPHVATVDAAAAAARELGPHALVVGLGGGTALDIAKLVAVAASADRPAEDYVMCRHPFAGRLRSIMIPSTSGTGAEVTRTCVLTDAAGSKSWAWGDELCPDVALLAPEVTVTLPPALTTTTGLDACIHAIEAATGQRTNAFTAAFAQQAIRLIVDALPLAVQEPHQLTTRRQMQEAACLAGMAINQSGTGIAHNIGHALGTTAHLPHAVAVTVAMAGTLAWNVAGARQRYALVADALCPGLAPEQVPAQFEALLEATGWREALAPFRQVRIDAAALRAAMLAPENRPMLTNNARPADEAAVEELAARTVAAWARFTGQEEAA